MSNAPQLWHDGPRDAALTLALAHGAGAPADSPFMQTVAEGLGARGLQVVRFEFPYMARRRSEGGRRPPDRQPVLLQAWRAVIDLLGADRLVIGGKSMGGRMASLLADEAGVRGLVCLGYPFHPAGRPERTRTEHLAGLGTPALIVQGTRDPLGSEAEVAGYTLPKAIRMHWCPDGDHDLKPRKASGGSHADNLKGAMDAIAAFMRDLQRPTGAAKQEARP